MARKFTGPEKAAILLMSMGEENAAKVMANMDEREIQAVGNYMSSLGDVDMGNMDSINKEFYDAVKSGAGALEIAGPDFLKTTLMKALDPAKATEILNNISTPGEEIGGGLETVRMLEPKTIAAFLVNEHPQTAAISGGFGRGSHHPVADGIGISQNAHLAIDLAHTGMLGGTMETIGKVKIQKVES